MDYRQAINDTVSYAAFFDFPLFPEEIHFWLISNHPVSFSKIKRLFPPPLSLTDQQKRRQLLNDSLVKTDLALQLTKFLRFVPGLRMIGLTGSTAAKNSLPEEDIDLLFVTAPHTLWLIRPLVLLLTGLFFRRRHPKEALSQIANTFCPNLWLDTLCLSIPKHQRSLYTAHEVLQVHPVFNRNQTYQSFLHQNNWVKKYLANAYQARIKESPALRHCESRYFELWQSPPSNRSDTRDLKSENFFFLLAPLNYLFYLFQLLYMSPKKTSEIVHLHGAFLHTTNFAQKLDHFLKRG